MGRAVSLTSEKHRAKLERFSELLLQEAYQTELVPAGGDVPYDTLLVRIESFEKENRVWTLELSYLAGLEDELDEVGILQCYVTLSDHISEEHRAALERLLVKLNATLPIGSFGVLENPRVVFFKHNAMLPNDSPTVSYQIVREIVPMTSYLISRFSGALLKIASGEAIVEEALPIPVADVMG